MQELNSKLKYLKWIIYVRGGFQVASSKVTKWNYLYLACDDNVTKFYQSTNCPTYPNLTII